MKAKFLKDTEMANLQNKELQKLPVMISAQKCALAVEILMKKLARHCSVITLPIYNLLSLRIQAIDNAVSH